MMPPMPDLFAAGFSPMLPLAVEFFDEGVFTTAALVSLLTLTLLEIILGIDNVVFIAILSGKLPEKDRAKARNLGLGLAAGSRVVLLFGATLVLALDDPKYTVIDASGWFGSDAAEVQPETAAGGDAAGDVEARPAAADVNRDGDEQGEAHEEGEHEPWRVTVKDLIILLGGLFLLAKATWEIHDKLEGEDHAHGTGKGTVTFGSVIFQILLLDMVFSIDSVITAVGIAEYLSIMIIAVLISVVIMIVFAGPISRFVEKHPTMKILALSFLILIGVLLVAEAFEQEIPKGYIYFSMAFSLTVEMLNIRLRKVSKPVTLHQSYVESKTPSGYGDVAEGRAFDVQPTTPQA